MKNTIIISGPEILAAIAESCKTHVLIRGRTVAAINLVADPDDADEDKRIRAHVVTFDTAAEAMNYQKTGTVVEAPAQSTEPTGIDPSQPKE